MTYYSNMCFIYFTYKQFLFYLKKCKCNSNNIVTKLHTSFSLNFAYLAYFAAIMNRYIDKRMIDY